MRAACLLLILASARSRDSLETILARIEGRGVGERRVGPLDDQHLQRGPLRRHEGHERRDARVAGGRVAAGLHREEPRVDQRPKVVRRGLEEPPVEPDVVGPEHAQPRRIQKIARERGREPRGHVRASHVAAGREPRLGLRGREVQLPHLQRLEARRRLC